MKRLLIILVALGLLVASAAPAGAKKPTPEHVWVTLTGDLDTAAGYLDTAKCGEPIEMEESRNGVLNAGEGVLTAEDEVPSIPRIWIEAPLDVDGLPTDWGRNFPAPISGEDFSISGEDFSGCHGGPVDGSPNDWGGLLRITPTADSVEILWIFDHYWEDGVAKPHGKKTGLIIENFDLRGEALLDQQSGFYTGDFTISYFLRDDSNGGYIQYADPGTVELSFQLSTSDTTTAQ